MQVYFLINNKQHCGKVGDTLYLDKISEEPGTIIKSDQVLVLGEKIGTPFLENVTVDWKVLKHGKQKKLHIIKFISQKRHRKRMGFRKEYTQIEILKINK